MKNHPVKCKWWRGATEKEDKMRRQENEGIFMFVSVLKDSWSVCLSNLVSISFFLAFFLSSPDHFKQTDIK